MMEDTIREPDTDTLRHALCRAGRRDPEAERQAVETGKKKQ